MIAKKSGLLILTSILLGAYAYAAPVKRVSNAQVEAESAVMTTDEAQKVLTSIQKVVEEMRTYSEKNRAPRPNAPRPSDPSYPVQTIDLTPILSRLCSIECKVCSILEEVIENTSTLETIQDKVCSIADVLGECTDISVSLPSIVDKEDIDNLCETVITLLKTILLELRGNFVFIP